MDRLGRAPAGSPRNRNDWIIGTAAQAPPSLGETARRAFARNSETIEFLSGVFGPYPFRTAGGIASSGDFGFTALENPTRPIYSATTFADPDATAGAVVHELAHQWFGDSLSVEQWRHMWLNEGFATYAQWLWNEREGRRSVQEQFDATYSSRSPAFWQIIIADPGVSNVVSSPVFLRGAMALHQLRLTVGDAAFFRVLRTWAADNAGTTVTTERLMAHAERVSGRDLDPLFTAWLFTPQQPPVANPPAATAAAPRLTLPKRAGDRI